MKIALAQIKVVVGRPDINFETMQREILNAKKENARLIVFPEMCIGGYMLGDWYRDAEYMRELMTYNDKIKELSNGIAIAYGNVYMDESSVNRDGRFKLYNAAYLYDNKQEAKRNYNAQKHSFKFMPEGVQFKTNLPDYRFFDDPRYFSSMIDFIDAPKHELPKFFSPFILDGETETIGLELCEDLWCADYKYDERMGYPKEINPTKWLIDNGANVIVNLSASPWTYGKNKSRHNRVKFVAKKCKKFVPFMYVNCVGVQNNGKNIITFDGGTTAYNQDAIPAKMCQSMFEEKVLHVDTAHLGRCAIIKRKAIEEKRMAIVEGLKGLKEIGGWDRNPIMVIGLSGGIDSAVAAALHTLAFGPDNVIAVNMPTGFNSDQTKNAAKKIAWNLGIRYQVVPINEAVSQNEDMMSQYIWDKNWREASLMPDVPAIVQENIQAKTRAINVLSNIAQIEGIENDTVGLYSCNGNKIEIAIGYYTLDGDGRGAINPIGDLTKAEVYAMAKHLNLYMKNPVIPNNLIPDKLFQFGKDKIKPSAELAKNQVDPIKVGYHCALVEAIMDYKKKGPADILRWWLDGTLAENLGIDPELIKVYKLKHPKIFIDDLEWIFKRIRASVPKRVQSVPVIVTSKTAYGFDYREPMLPPMQWTAEYNKLKTMVLQREFQLLNGRPV